MDARRQLHVEEERGRLLRMKLEKVESATEGMQLKPDDKRFVQVLALFGGDQIMQASLDAEKKQAEVQRLKNLVAKRREELEDCALQVARARDRVAQVEAPYRSEIARLAEEEKALMARIMSDPTARELYEASEERRQMAADEEAALLGSIEAAELELISLRERAIVDEVAIAAFHSQDGARIEIYNEWRRAQLARTKRDRENRLTRKRELERARVKAEAESLVARTQDRIEIEALEARRDEYAAQAESLHLEITEAEAEALATGRLLRGAARELQQLRVALRFETAQRAESRDAILTMGERIRDATAQLDLLAEEERARIARELATSMAPQLEAAQSANATAHALAEKRAESYLKVAQQTVTDRYAEGFEPMLAEANETLRAAEEGASVAAAELRAKQAELVQLQKEIAGFGAVIDGAATTPLKDSSENEHHATKSVEATREWEDLVNQLFRAWDVTREDPRIVAAFLERLLWKDEGLFERAPAAARALEQLYGDEEARLLRLQSIGAACDRAAKRGAGSSSSAVAASASAAPTLVAGAPADSLNIIDVSAARVAAAGRGAPSTAQPIYRIKPKQFRTDGQHKPSVHVNRNGSISILRK